MMSVRPVSEHTARLSVACVCEDLKLCQKRYRIPLRICSASMVKLHAFYRWCLPEV